MVPRLFLLGLLWLGGLFWQAETAVSYTIYYDAPNAESVMLVWGINDWQVVPTAAMPPNTTIDKGVMSTPMQGNNGTFAIQLTVPEGAMIDFGFLQTAVSSNTPTWDGNNGQDYHATAVSEGSITIEAQQTAPLTPNWWGWVAVLLLTLVSLLITSTVIFAPTHNRH